MQWLWQGSMTYGGRFADEQAARQAAITLYNRLVPEGARAYIRHDAAAVVQLDSSCATDEPASASASESLPSQPQCYGDQDSDDNIDIADPAASSHAPLLSSQEQPEPAGADASRQLAAQASASSRPAQRTDLLACPKVHMQQLLCTNMGPSIAAAAPGAHQIIDCLAMAPENVFSVVCCCLGDLAGLYIKSALWCIASFVSSILGASHELKGRP